MLFPEVKQDIRISTREMSSFEFLSRCYRPECAAVRHLLEDWYSHYPEHERRELRARLAADDINHRSAFWELYLHELLRCLGYSLDIHPHLPTKETTQPDFLAKSLPGEEVIIEAVVTIKKSGDDVATANRKHTALDVIDRLDHPNFYVFLSEEGAPDNPPSGRKIRNKIERWLSGLNYDDCLAMLDSGRIDDLPTRTFEKWS